MVVSATSDPDGNSLLLDGWTITAPATSAIYGSATTGTYFQIVAPAKFTGTFTNFRRYVLLGGYYGVNNFSVSQTTGNYIYMSAPTVTGTTIIVAGMTNGFTGAPASAVYYFIFEYLPSSIII
jgi:hypothetical protein